MLTHSSYDRQQNNHPRSGRSWFRTLKTVSGMLISVRTLGEAGGTYHRPDAQSRPVLYTSTPGALAQFASTANSGARTQVTGNNDPRQVATPSGPAQQISKTSELQS